MTADKPSKFLPQIVFSFMIFLFAALLICPQFTFAEDSKNASKVSGKNNAPRAGDDKSNKEDDDSGKMSDETKMVLSKIVFYFPNLFLDFVDIIKLNVGIGPGLGARVQATEPLQAGIIMYDAVRIGLNGRFDYYRRESSLEFGIGYAYYQDGEIKRDNFEIAGIVHLLVFGVEAGVNLVELGDFIGCIFFCDAKEDDLYFE